MRKIITDHSITLYPCDQHEVESVLASWIPNAGIEFELKKAILKEPGLRIRIVIDRWEPLDTYCTPGYIRGSVIPK